MQSCENNQNQFCYICTKYAIKNAIKAGHIIICASRAMQCCTNAAIVETMEACSLLYQQTRKNRKLKGFVNSA